MEKMICEKGNPVIVYLYDDEIQKLVSSGEGQRLGYAYTWEGENVAHLHISPAAHAFGSVSNCLFSTQETDSRQLERLLGQQIPWCVSIVDGKITVFKIQETAETVDNVHVVPAKADLYSRSKGILEIGILEKKHVAIIGLGSFGSQIAIELAKSGVGEYSIFDFDRVELHNLARHTCTIKDLGRLKTDAIEESVMGKNPYAIVHKYPIDITQELNLLEEILPSVDLVICATDNNKSRIGLSELLYKHSKIGIFGRAISRAEGGDVFIYRPGGPCYCCLIGKIGNINEEITSVASGRANGTIPQYADNPEAMVQVGLSSDIEPICNMMVKLSLVELSKGESSGISSLENELVYDYYIWANRRDNTYSNWYPMPKAGGMPTIMRWYGAHIQRVEQCALCSNSSTIELDEGDEDADLLSQL